MTRTVSELNLKLLVINSEEDETQTLTTIEEGSPSSRPVVR